MTDRFRYPGIAGSILLLALFLPAPAAMAAADTDRAITGDYPLTRITDNVYVIHGPNEDPTPENKGFRNNPALVLTSDGVVVIDPGSSMYTGELVVHKARSLTDKPIVAVFNTHIHGDHWLGNQGIVRHWPVVSIYAHPTMKTMAEAGDGDMWIEAINKRTDNAIAGTEAVAPTRAVKNGDVISIGDTRFRVHNNGKAHTNHDLMIEIPKEKVLYCGDIVRSRNVSPYLQSASGNIEAIDMALRMDVNSYIPGHGQSDGKAVVRTYRRFLETLHDSVAKYYDQGLSDFEMKPRVIRDLADFRDWVGFEENIGRLVSLTYLEVEREAFQ